MSALQDQIALVTGASRGIGRAIALALAEAGAHVAINYRSHDGEAEEVAAAIRQAGGSASLHRADVADQSAVDALVERIVAERGRLDIAVTNACFSDREPFYDADMDGFHRTLDVTMWGAFYTLRAASRAMIARRRAGDERGGSIVVISSPHAYVPVPRAMAYNMSKAALDQMARTAAIELAEFRIRVNLIHPGWIDTPGERKYASEEQIQRSGEKLPWGRLGQPEEIARGVVFVCDPRSDYMTGSSLLIDGGITLPWWASRGTGVPE